MITFQPNKLPTEFKSKFFKSNTYKVIRLNIKSFKVKGNTEKYMNKNKTQNVLSSRKQKIYESQLAV